MIRWLLLLPFNLITMLLCYITNPIVVLFADEVGELHGVWRYWSTWDDSCDGAFQVSCMPKFLQYDFHSKYNEHSMTLKGYNRTKYYVTLKEGATFTLWERIQRYFCRLGWLTRNCGYGFAFYFAGEDIRPYFSETIINEPYVKFGFNGYKDMILFDTPWTYQDSRRVFSLFGYNLYRNFYLGWKFNPLDRSMEKTRVMVANRIAWKIRKGEPQDGLL